MFGISETLDLVKLLDIPEGMAGRTLRWRVDYGREISGMQYDPYEPVDIRKLRVVDGRDITYTFKFADRSLLESMRAAAGTDEILIVKDGCLTDASRANLVFIRAGRWYTPDTPLLAGTRRQSLIDRGQLLEQHIPLKNIRDYESLMLINALRPPDRATAIPVTAIQTI